MYDKRSGIVFGQYTIDGEHDVFFWIRDLPSASSTRFQMNGNVFAWHSLTLKWIIGINAVSTIRRYATYEHFLFDTEELMH